MKISDVEHIHTAGYGHPILEREDIATYVELPLLPACEDFFDKNIKTLGNNTGDDNKISNIQIAYESLSYENKDIARNLVALGIATIDNSLERGEDTIEVTIQIPTSSGDDVRVVQQKFLDVSGMFLAQDILFGRYSAAETMMMADNLSLLYGGNVRQKYFTNNGVIDILGSVAFLKDVVNYGPYIESEGMLYQHPSYYDRHLSFINSKSRE